MSGVAAAFMYDNPEDKQSVELQKKVKAQGIAKAIAEGTGFEEGSTEHSKILDAYHSLRREYQRPN